MSEASDLYRPPAPRLSPCKSKLCTICCAWGDHFADGCPSLDEDEEPDPAFVALQLVEARKKLGGK